MAKKVLGRGLEAIISTPINNIGKELVEDADRIVNIEIDKIIPNPDQPRTDFDESKIISLSESIKSVGLLQPIIVRKTGNNYTLIAGERRLRATKLAGQDKIRSIIIEADKEKNLIFTLIENIQRADLNPIEEANAYKELAGRFKLKQEDIARQVGKERATISNLLRLLNLPEEIQQGIMDNKITTGHAKVLLSVSGSRMQKALYHEIINKELSVRILEKLVNKEKERIVPDGSRAKAKNAHIKQMEEKLVSILGTKVEIKHSGSKGKIEISFYSLDDFDRIIDLFQ